MRSQLRIEGSSTYTRDEMELFFAPRREGMMSQHIAMTSEFPTQQWSAKARWQAPSGLSCNSKVPVSVQFQDGNCTESWYRRQSNSLSLGRRFAGPSMATTFCLCGVACEGSACLALMSIVSASGARTDSIDRHTNVET